MTTEQFDTDVAKARLKDAQYRQSLYGEPMNSIAEIAYCALDELDRLGTEAEKRQATDDGRLKYRGCKPNEHGELIPIPEEEAVEHPAVDDAAMNAWIVKCRRYPSRQHSMAWRVGARQGWRERGRRAEAELHERLDELNTRWQEELDLRDKDAETAEAVERELRAEIAKLQGTILACHRAFRGGSDFVQLEARRMASEVFSQTFPHKATLDELNCLRKAVAAKREVQR